MNLKVLTLIIFGSAPQILPAQQNTITTSSLYEIVDGTIVLPWDKLSKSNNTTTSIIAPADFPSAHVYRDQLLLESGAVISNPVRLPAGATTFSVTARSRPAGDIFPRIRISLLTPDNNRHRLFEGYWQTISMETWHWPISEWVRDKTVRLQIELLNSGLVEEQRTWYFQDAAVQLP